MAVLYACVNSVEASNSFINLIKEDPITFYKNKEIGILYATLAQSSKIKFKEQLEYLQLAAKHFAKSKDWLLYCQVQLKLAKLWNDSNCFRESIHISQKIEQACFNLTDEIQLGL